MGRLRLCVDPAGISVPTLVGIKRGTRLAFSKETLCGVSFELRLDWDSVQCVVKDVEEIHRHLCMANGTCGDIGALDIEFQSTSEC